LFDVMTMVQDCWVTITYDWGDGGLPIVRSHDVELLRLAKKKIIEEAQVRARISSDIDPVIAMLDEAELTRISRVLDILVPDGDHGHPAEDI
jgi:hypothetical protein